MEEQKSRPTWEKTHQWLVKQDLSKILQEVVGSRSVRAHFTWHPGIKGSNGHTLNTPDVKEILIAGLQRRYTGII